MVPHGLEKVTCEDDAIVGKTSNPQMERKRNLLSGVWIPMMVSYHKQAKEKFRTFASKVLIMGRIQSVISLESDEEPDVYVDIMAAITWAERGRGGAKNCEGCHTYEMRATR